MTVSVDALRTLSAMATPFKAPEFKGKTFTCIHRECFAHSLHTWEPCGVIHAGSRGTQDGALWRSSCVACDRHIYWVNGQPVWPESIIGSDPNDQMPADLVPLYEQARAIAMRSPIGAAALLRLLVDLLTKHLKAQGKDLYERTRWLADQRIISSTVTKMVDAVRITGKYGVHDGYLDPDQNDDLHVVEALFEIVNAIVAEAIERPLTIERLHHGKKLRGETD